MSASMTATVPPATPPLQAAGADWAAAVAPVAGALRELDARLHAQAAEFDPGIAPFLEYALDSQGKRLRPVLALLSGAATRPDGAPDALHVDLAMVMEMIHLATLVHDDIMDGAEQRRGRPTASLRWGPDLAVLLGDCLFSHALRLCARRFSQEVSQEISSAVCEVCTGEILQTRRRFDLDLSLEDYLRILRMKTAELFRVACLLAGRLSGAPAAACDALGRYGEALGVAYQIYDDCLDLLGREEEAGKTLGTDLERGKLTLPFLYLLQALSGAEREAAAQALLHGTPAERAALVAQARERGMLAKSLAFLDKHLAAAAEALAVLPPSAARESLAAIAASVGRAAAALT